MKFPDIKKLPSFKKAVKEVEAAKKKARGVRKVNSDEDLQIAAEVLAEVVKVNRLNDNIRLEEGKPFRDHAEELSTEFNELLAPLDGIEERLKREISAFEEEAQDRVEEERIKAEEKAQKRQEQENKKAERLGREPIVITPPEIPDAPTTIKTSGGGSIQGKTNWKYEIEDASKLPREFLQPDKGAINKAVKGGKRKIPGVKIFRDTSQAVSI